MESYLFSAKGPRPNNQDAVSLNYIDDGILLCVADGVGGNKGGETASKLAIEVFTREVIGKQNSFRGAMEIAHKTILQKAAKDEELNGMATTFTAALITTQKIVGVHSGDSRAYVLRGHGLKQLTTDHSEVAKLLREGKISKEAAVDYPRKNVVYSALGSHKPLEINEFELGLTAKDRIVLITDGFHGVISKTVFRDSSLNAFNLKDWCDTVVTILEGIGATDNYTMAAVELD